MAPEINVGDVVRVRGFRGMACYFRGHPTHQREVWSEEFGVEIEETEDTERAIVVMVGDDRRHTVYMDDLSPLPREDYCADCGQIGCGHNTEG